MAWCLDPNGVQAHRLQFGREHPPIISGIFAAHEEEAVGLFEGRTIERLGLQMIEDHPVLLLQRSSADSSPTAQSARATRLFQTWPRQLWARSAPFGSDLCRITVHRQIVSLRMVVAKMLMKR